MRHSNELAANAIMASTVRNAVPPRDEASIIDGRLRVCVIEVT
jgi:hypothetical protein